MLRKICALAATMMFLLTLVVVTAPDAEARKRSRSVRSSSSTSRHYRSGGGSSVHSSRHHRRHHTSRVTSGRRRHHKVTRAAAKPKYAYPLELFMMNPPEFDRTPLPDELAKKVRKEFDRGIADRHHPNDLVRAGIVQYHPLRGGIFKRREQVKYIIVHSTETGPPVSATSVIDAWSSLGRRHAGAQYVVERNGVIYQSCEPDLATVHVNIFKTLPGINNDNSIGIEMNHTGKQNYPREQRESVKKLVAYLQDRYHVLNENVITHRYAQQGDHTDPVAFDFEAFLAQKDEFRNNALAMKRELGVPTAPPVAAPTTVVQTTTTAEVVPPKAPDFVPPPPAPEGVPLPGSAMLRKEIEMDPEQAAAVRRELEAEMKLEDALEPMQHQQPPQLVP